ncbi:MAG: hypothetical protein AAGG81_05280 [Chlamydiota bacterium]
MSITPPNVNINPPLETIKNHVDFLKRLEENLKEFPSMYQRKNTFYLIQSFMEIEFTEYERSYFKQAIIKTNNQFKKNHGKQILFEAEIENKHEYTVMVREPNAYKPAPCVMPKKLTIKITSASVDITTSASVYRFVQLQAHFSPPVKIRNQEIDAAIYPRDETAVISVEETSHSKILINSPRFFSYDEDPSVPRQSTVPPHQTVDELRQSGDSYP